MDAEVLCTLCHQLLVAVDHLLLGHAVLGIAGLVHDLEALLALAQLEGPARVERQKMFSGIPATRSRKSTMVASSRLMYAPSSYAFFMSSTGVWLEENMISLPVKPQASLSISSVREEQSTPHPSSFRICEE